MRIDPTIIHVKADRELKFLEVNAGRCPVTGMPRTFYEVESKGVIEYYLSPQIVSAIYAQFPEGKEAEIPEAFQVKWEWID